MSQNVYLVLALVIMGGAALSLYRTAPPALPAASGAEFGGVSLRIEYATTAAERERGLGGHASIPGDYGMLFTFQKNDYYGFWMKEMLAPIDIFWLDDKGQVVFIANEVATSTYPNVFYPSAPARYVLETAAGFARAHDIKIGARLLLKVFPSVMQ